MFIKLIANSIAYASRRFNIALKRALQECHFEPIKFLLLTHIKLYSNTSSHICLSLPRVLFTGVAFDNKKLTNIGILTKKLKFELLCFERIPNIIQYD